MSINSERKGIIKDLKDIKILSQPLQKSIEKIAEEEGYTSCDISVRSFNTKGGNFLGDLYEVDIKGKTCSCVKETNIFIKQKINLEKTVFISITDAYKNEEFVYNELSEIFTVLQDKANVPADERFKLAKSYSETTTEAIILENLSVKGFKTYDRMDVFPSKFIELIIQQMAKFHGLSFVIEHKMPEYYDNKIKVLEHPFCYDEDWSGFMQKICTYVAELCEDTTKAKVEKFIPVILDKYSKYNRDKTSTKCTLTHGGYRSANILVREHDGEPVEAIAVDYQFMDYGCPVRDLLYAILANTDQEFRRNHMSGLKELYFKTLSTFLKYFDIDVETVYPKSEFEKTYSEWLDYGLMKMLFGLPFMFASHNGVDLKTMSLAEIPFSVNKNIQANGNIDTGKLIQSLSVRNIKDKDKEKDEWDIYNVPCFGSSNTEKRMLKLFHLASVHTFQNVSYYRLQVLWLHIPETHRLHIEVYNEAALSEICRECFQKLKNDDFAIEDKDLSDKPKIYDDAELELLLEKDSSQIQKVTLEVTQQRMNHS